jgi:endonuclease IV/DNA polymerase/3'-5' exonuclease PolX
MNIGTHLDCDSCFESPSWYQFLLGAIKQSKSLGCNYIQTFSGNKMSTSLKQKFAISEDEIKKVRKTLKHAHMTLVFHAILNINMASPLERPYFWNFQNIWHDVQRLHAIGSPKSFLVIHMGSFKTQRFQLSKEEGMKDWIQNTKYLLQRMHQEKITYPRILFETPSTFTNKIGATWEDIHTFWKAMTKEEKKHLGFCLDTAHLFVLGVPVHTVEGIEDCIDQIVMGKKGKVKEMIGAIHLNDATYPLGSFHDVHASLGTGHIFSPRLGGSFCALKAWTEFAKKYGIPCILETRNIHIKEELKLIRKVQSYSYETLKQIESNMDHLMHTLVPTTLRRIGKKKGGSKKNWKERILEIFSDLEQFHTLLPKEYRNAATPYRIRGYQQAIQQIQLNEHPIRSIHDIDQYYSDIGSKTMEKMKEIVRRKGHLAMHDEILKTPWFAARQEFSHIKGFGPAFIDQLIQKQIWSLKDLKEAVKRGTITLNHMQELGLKYKNQLSKPIPRKRIESIASQIAKETGKEIHLAGSYRTGKKESGDIDLIITDSTWTKQEDVVSHVEEVLGSITGIVDYFVRGSYYVSCIYQYKGTYQQMDIRCVPKPYVETYMLYFGSGVVFSRLIRQRAKQLGYKLTEWGLFDIRTGTHLDIYTEREIMDFLKVVYVPPEKRRLITTLTINNK